MENEWHELTPEERIDKLDERIRILEARVESLVERVEGAVSDGPHSA